MPRTADRPAAPGSQVIDPAEDIAAIDPFQLYIGSHHPGWLWRPDIGFPLCVSFRSLAGVVTPRPATCRWMLDSGAYTELKDHGAWTVTPLRYVQEVARLDREAGSLDWAATQDWMCEPWVIHGGWHDGQHYAGTHLSVLEHQKRSVANYRECVRWWPEFSDAECPFMPPVQGWEIWEYEQCVRMYEDAGINLSGYPVVGLGSVCRRQGTAEITYLAEMLTPRFAIHGFGVKTRGLLASDRFTSADSMAWSYDAYRSAPLPGHQHQTCSNCPEYARRWRAALLDRLGEGRTRTWRQALPLTWQQDPA
jgi:hypothetical protein